MRRGEFEIPGDALGYFRRETDGGPENLVALPIALSGWGSEQLRGNAVAGALARSAEVAGRARPDLRPARFTVDLHTPAKTGSASTESTIVRQSRRLMLVDSNFVQDGQTVARGRTLFLPASAGHRAEMSWSPDRHPGMPPGHLIPATDEGRLYYSERAGWTSDAANHQDDSRKQLWGIMIPAVAGEAISAFQAAAAIADHTNLVTNWGANGNCHINADVTLVLARLPLGSMVGLSATGRVGVGELSIGTAEMYDSEGVFGYTTVSTIEQTRRSVETVAQLMRGARTTGQTQLDERTPRP